MGGYGQGSSNAYPATFTKAPPYRDGPIQAATEKDAEKKRRARNAGEKYGVYPKYIRM